MTNKLLSELSNPNNAEIYSIKESAIVKYSLNNASILISISIFYMVRHFEVTDN